MHFALILVLIIFKHPKYTIRKKCVDMCARHGRRAIEVFCQKSRREPKKDWETLFYTNSLLQVRFSPTWMISQKILSYIGQLGLSWMSPSKARANQDVRTPTTNDIVLFRSLATWTRKARYGTKIYEQWQGPKKRARVSWQLSEVGP